MAVLVSSVHQQGSPSRFSCTVRTGEATVAVTNSISPSRMRM